MKTYKLVNEADPNDQSELYAAELAESYEEALTMLGYKITVSESPDDPPDRTITAHTPGPWTVTGHSWSHSIVANSEQIARLNHTGTPANIAEANARLIAAAPDLLAALKAMINTHGMHGPCSKNSCADCNRAYTQAHAAIDYAEGRA